MGELLRSLMILLFRPHGHESVSLESTIRLLVAVGEQTAGSKSSELARELDLADQW